MLKNSLGFFGSLASIVALFFVEAEWTWWRILVLIVCGVIALACMFFDVKEYIRNRPLVFHSQEAINAYMKNWISTSGEVVVYSRDLSWVNDEIKGIMLGKGKDLTIFVHQSTLLTDSLQQAGVHIYLYENIPYQPVSRFTIIRANKNNRQIAIANPQNSRGKLNHEIYESSDKKGDKFLLDLSADVVNLTKCIGKACKAEK